MLKNIDVTIVLTIIFGFSAVTFGVIAIIQARRAQKFAKQVATIQGAFKKPDIKIMLYNEEDTKNIILAFPISKDRVLEVPLMLSIKNDGDKTTKNVEVFLKIPKELHYSGFGNLDIQGAKKIKKFDGEVISETNHIHTVGFSFENLKPQQTLKLKDYISIRSDTSIESEVVATTKNGKDVKIKYSVDYAYVIDFTIMQDDYETLTRRFSLSIIDTSDMAIKEYFERRNKVAIERYKKDKMSSKKEIEKFYLIFSKHDNFIQESADLPIYQVQEDSLTGCKGLVIKDIYCYHIPALEIKCPLISSYS